MLCIKDEPSSEILDLPMRYARPRYLSLVDWITDHVHAVSVDVENLDLLGKELRDG